jgi:hypothetical protein
MSRTYLSVFKKLKLIKDGSSIYIYHNGCNNSISLQLKDIVNHPSWIRQDLLKKEKSSHPHLDKYKKKFKF